MAVGAAQCGHLDEGRGSASPDPIADLIHAMEAMHLKLAPVAHKQKNHQFVAEKNVATVGLGREVAVSNADLVLETDAMTGLAHSSSRFVDPVAVAEASEKIG